MVLQDEQEMATPGDSESPLAAENEAPSPTPSTQTTEEVKDMVATDAPAEDDSLPGMVPDDPGDEAPEAASDMAPTDPDDSEEPAPVSEDVIAEPENAAETESTEVADAEPVEETMVKEIIGNAEGMMDEVNAGAKNAMQSIGGKITDFLGGNMRKVRSLLHINEKLPEGDDMTGVCLAGLKKFGCKSDFLDEAKAMSSSTGNLAQAVKKSKACTIL